MELTLAPWTPADLAVLERANTGAMTLFLGGPESPEELAARHAEYLGYSESGDGAMFRVEADGRAIGYAGWWSEVHDGEPVYEVGCSIEPGWQGHGVATWALLSIVRLSAQSPNPRALVGYAGIDNTASNALCRRAGFQLVATGAFPAAEGDFEVNIWWLDPEAALCV